MLVADDFAPGNAGGIFYTDIGIPLVGFALLWLQHRLGRESPPASTTVMEQEPTGT